MHLCIYIYMHLYIYKHIYIYKHMYIYICVCVPLCTSYWSHCCVMLCLGVWTCGSTCIYACKTCILTMHLFKCIHICACLRPFICQGARIHICTAKHVPYLVCILMYPALRLFWVKFSRLLFGGFKLLKYWAVKVGSISIILAILNLEHTGHWDFKHVRLHKSFGLA
jgi:hypothetical protein